jgi:hypothetical protein
MVAALCTPSGLARAQTRPATPSLPAGTRLDFVAGQTINADGVLLAPAAVAARPVVTGRDEAP